jgi:hypothetical protein
LTFLLAKQRRPTPATSSNIAIVSRNITFINKIQTPLLSPPRPLQVHWVLPV